MRNRVITALFIIGIFLLGYFAFDGTALKFLLIFCLLIAFMVLPALRRSFTGTISSLWMSSPRIAACMSRRWQLECRKEN